MSFNISNQASSAVATGLKGNRAKLGESSVRLASGKKVVTAKDDAAGVATSVRLTSSIAALRSASGNISSARNLLATVDGTLAEVTNLLTRYKTIASSGVNGSYTADDFAAIEAEGSLLKQELDRLATSSSFNGKKFADGTFSNKFAVGASVTSALDPDNDDIIEVDLSSVSVSASALGLTSDLLSDSSSAAASSEASSALSTIAIERAKIGALLSRFEIANNANDAAINSLNAAKSVIEDTDYSEETSKFAEKTVLVQAGTAMLAQANQVASNVLKLLQ